MRLSDAFEYFDKKDDGSISFQEVGYYSNIPINYDNDNFYSVLIKV